MKIYELHQRQQFPLSSAEMWSFIADPKNLSVITPPSMRFNTISGDTREMFPGQIIQYTITPLFGIKMKWVTEITHVTEGTYFVDEQRYGPYALWHHKHFLKDIPGGVEMEDLVHYKLPLGFLGRLAHPILVAPELRKIFEFRRRKLIELFGTLNQTP